MESLKNFPEMLTARPLVVNEEGQVIGGNMRLKALRELGVKEAPAVVVNWSKERQEEFMIKDNLSFGEFDWDMVANEWEQVKLEEWGVDPFYFGTSSYDVLPEDEGIVADPKESDAPKLTDGFVKAEFIMEDEQKREVMKVVREYADAQGLQLGAALHQIVTAHGK